MRVYASFEFEEHPKEISHFLFYLTETKLTSVVDNQMNMEITPDTDAF